MFQIRKETDYAIQFLQQLVKNKGAILSLGDVAQETGLSFLFLQKIARKLKQGGLIKASKGATGGYILSLPASKITFKRILEITEGKCGLMPCGVGEKPEGKCHCFANCRLKKKLGKVNLAIVKIFQKTKLTDL